MLLSTFSSSSGNPLPPFPRPPLHSPTRPALRWGQPMGGTRDAARGGCEQSTRGSVPQASPLMQAKHRSYDGGRGVLEPAAGRAATGGVLPPATVGEPEVIWDKAAMRAWSRRRRAEGKTVVLVPTMGFLHEGHLSLVSAAAAVAGPVAVVVSIYVNPGQFARTEDFATYPSDLAGDLRKLASTGAVHAVFNPPDLYDRGAAVSGHSADASGGAACCVEAGSDGHETWIRVERLEKGLCGDSRPVFFRGVATVVAKLFNVVEPDVAMFGKKDYQQWRVICRMVRDLDFAIEVIGSEIVREADGLAMSSRNVRLSPEEREKALSISRSLVNARTAVLNNSNSASEHIKDHIVQTLTEAGGRVDYIEIVEQESLVPVETIDRPVVICVAAWFGKVRLIDNIEIHSQS